MDTLELLAHPVRLRIVHAMRGGRLLTTAELGARLPDVSKAMLYRHVDLLAAQGILEVAQEQRVRGAVERSYRLRQDRAAITPEAGAALSPDDHRRAFAAAMAALLAEFSAYLDRDDADPAARPGRLPAARDLAQPRRARAADRRAAPGDRSPAGQPATPDRARYLLSPILFPLEPPSAAARVRMSRLVMCTRYVFEQHALLRKRLRLRTPSARSATKPASEPGQGTPPDDRTRRSNATDDRRAGSNVAHRDVVTRSRRGVRSSGRVREPCERLTEGAPEESPEVVEAGLLARQ